MAVPQVKWRRAYCDIHGLATTLGIATDESIVRHSGRKEDVMQGNQGRQPWALTWLMLVLAVPAWAQVTRVGEERQPQPEARIQVTQNLTIAVCGDTVTAALQRAWPKSRRHARCSRPRGVVQSAAGNVVCVPLPIPSRCVVTPVTDSAGSLLTRVSAPCDVTSSAGSCNIGSGQCCVCTTN